MPGEFRANIHLGGTSIIKVTEEKRIAIKTAKAMDLKVAGVDIFVPQGPLLLEVNSSRIRRIEGATNKDIAGEMIKAIEKHFKNKSGSKIIISNLVLQLKNKCIHLKKNNLMGNFLFIKNVFY
jgi:ribosomal protein S6--L-glutamate ligase